MLYERSVSSVSASRNAGRPDILDLQVNEDRDKVSR